LYARLALRDAGKDQNELANRDVGFLDAAAADDLMAKKLSSQLINEINPLPCCGAVQKSRDGAVARQ